VSLYTVNKQVQTLFMDLVPRKTGWASSRAISCSRFFQEVLLSLPSRADPLLRDLHWLQSPERIDFKIAMFVDAYTVSLLDIYRLPVLTTDNFVYCHPRCYWSEEHDSSQLATEAVFAAVCHASLRQLHSLYSGNGSKLTFLHVRPHFSHWSLDHTSLSGSSVTTLGHSN